MTATSRATISARPAAELAPREGDELLRSEELQQFELFASLKKLVSVEKFPGSIVLRRFRKGDVICRQGDRGHSAFYIVRDDDMRKLRDFRASRGGGTATKPAKSSGDQTTVDASARQVATAYILSGQAKASSGFLSKLFARKPRGAEQTRPEFIPNDGPQDIDYATRKAPMHEGDVFGEMSCMTLAPRSASIVVDEDCYMVEFLRNIFDQMQRDTGYRQKTDELYAERVLSMHLRRLELFQDLTDDQVDVLRQASHLEVVEPGAVICDEGDLSDSVYLIRSGVVQVVRGAHVVFRASDIADWPKFCEALLAADSPASDEKKEAPPAKPAAKPAAGSSVADMLAAMRGGGKPAKSNPEPKPEETSAEPPKKKAPTPGATQDILAASRAAMKPKADSTEKNFPAERPVKPRAAKSSASVADIMAAAKKARSPATPDPPADRNSVPLIVASAPKLSGDAARCVWSWFTSPVQASIRSLAEGGTVSDEDRRRVVRAVNELIRRREFVTSADMLPVFERPAMRDTIDTFPLGLQGAKKRWSELEIRIAGALAFRELFHATLSKVPVGRNPPDILAYLSRGDCFGEMAVVLGAPRQATCIAYDHPTDDTNRKAGRVELVRIEGAAFQKLLNDSPSLRASIDAIVSKRYAGIVGSDLRQTGDAETSLTHSEEFRDEGLVQGQNLLLIDLDRCTRCGDCVRACVNTHDDGYSRLFLDGPRFDRFLVPSACRQCLNPSCMIGCPVGSIQRGANGQIEIRDWCIGCGLCARQCPYDSIQMHDLGIIPEQSVGWQFASASQVGKTTWQNRRYRSMGWSVGVAPFNWTIDLFEALASSASLKSWQTHVGRVSEPICFRYEFQLSGDQLRDGPFVLAVSSKGLTVRAWVNGTPVAAAAPENPKKAKVDELQAQIESKRLRRGGNLLAVELSPPASEAAGGFAPEYNQPILTARLDPLPKAGALALATAGQDVDLEMEPLKQMAVVCDLCSSLASQRPACVDQCPHEAAIRVDARSEFPAC